MFFAVGSAVFRADRIGAVGVALAFGLVAGEVLRLRVTWPTLLRGSPGCYRAHRHPIT
jgi:hypothetical protein